MNKENKFQFKKKYHAQSPKGDLSLTGFTLLELIIASSIVILIILSETAVYVAAVKTMRQSLWRSFVQNDVNIALYHMSKTLRQGYNISLVSSSQVRVSVDTSVNPTEIANHTNAVTSEYNVTSNELRYISNITTPSNYTVLAKGVQTFSLSVSGRTLSVTLKCTSNDQSFTAQEKISLRCMAAGST
ncbi:MAG: hypothetical protein FJZ16_06500 [Candidatus Omnitrophica bacterium]|nr:hypothetical protein [Candidatus Omnitrophota bacterium]